MRTHGTLGPIVVMLAAVAASPARAQWPPWLEKNEPPPVYPAILVAADALVDDAFLALDVRGEERFGGGHVPGSHPFPIRGMQPADVAPRLAACGVTGTEQIVCVGERDDVFEVARLFWLLEAAGCRDVLILDGGLEAWSAAGRPLVSATPAATPVRSGLTADGARTATMEFVRERFGRPDPGRPDTEILDARPEEEWAGTGRPDGGHIPHSLPVDVGSFLRPDGRFMAAESIRVMIDRLGPRPATTVDLSRAFVTTDDGVSGAGTLAYLALRLAGVADVRYYPGGWNEWQAHGQPRVRIASAAEIRLLLADAQAGRREVILADVRGDADFGAGHIPTAIPIAPSGFGDALEAILAARPADAPREAVTFVAYCYGETCVRSRNAATSAAQRGIRDAIWFRGGLPEWLASGGPVARGE